MSAVACHNACRQVCSDVALNFSYSGFVHKGKGTAEHFFSFIWYNVRERDHWGDLGLDGWIILGWISRRWDVGMWAGLGWPRIVTGGGRL